jgi:hypothetical protein
MRRFDVSNFLNQDCTVIHTQCIGLRISEFRWDGIIPSNLVCGLSQECCVLMTSHLFFEGSLMIWQNPIPPVLSQVHAIP